MEIMRKWIKLQYKFCFVIGVVFITTQLPTTIPTTNAASTYNFTWHIRSAEGYLEDLPCSYRGTSMNHEEQLAINECTTCTCLNSTVRCTITPCPNTVCYKPFYFDGACCHVCQHYVPIYEVKATNLLIAERRGYDDINFDLNVTINRQGSSVSGEGLWKLGVWGSCNADGEGKRISYQEQVLTDEHAATRLTRPQEFRTYELYIRNISVSLDRTGDSCSEIGFICYEFNKGDSPVLKDPRIPFTVEGVAEEDYLRGPVFQGIVFKKELTPAPENLKGCVPKYIAAEDRSCNYWKENFLDGDQLIVDLCTTCICQNRTVRCDTRSCPPNFCDEPFNLDDMCCPVCPHYVPVYEVKTTNLIINSEPKTNNINFDLNVKINAKGTSVSGEGLWKLGMWGSCNADGEGKRISYQEQALTDEQATTRLQRPRFFRGYEFHIRNISVSLDRTGDSCSEIEFICYEFNKGDSPVLKEPRIPFTVEGVSGEGDLTPAPENLKGCIPVNMTEKPQSCRYNGNIKFGHGEIVVLSCDNGTVQEDTEGCPSASCDTPVKFDGECCKRCPYSFRISETTACLINGSVVDGRSSNPYKITYNIIMGDGNTVEERGLWQLTAYGSATADGSGDKLNPTTETFDARLASVKFSGQFVYFGKVDFDISMHGQTCDTVKYVCVELGIGSRYSEQFDVVGIEEDALRSCVHAFCEV